MSTESPVGQLDSFNPAEREQALRRLKEKVILGELPPKPCKGFINLHAHSFLSFNCYGYSPSHIVWQGFQEGLESVGTIEFDVLDAVEETLKAGAILGIRTVAGLESRVFVPEYADMVLNSPKEPGIHYAIATGFYRLPEKGSRAEQTLNKMRTIARDRNLVILEKTNAHLDSVRLDYENDVLPLTPLRNATERHILEAYDRKTRTVFPEPDKLAEFWSRQLSETKEKILSILGNRPNLQELIRMKLMKYGGISYVPPEPKNFPSLSETVDMIIETGGLPSGGWLDGTNEGEKDIEKLLGFFIDTQHVLLNIVPDRNWNIKDPEEKKLKVAKLKETIECARKLKLPLIGGTEMNKSGQKFVDDFDAPELKPYLDDFRKGAFMAYGHTMLSMYANRGFFSSWAKENFPDRVKRSEFYIRAGQSLQPGESIQEQVKIFLK